MHTIFAYMLVDIIHTDIYYMYVCIYLCPHMPIKFVKYMQTCLFQSSWYVQWTHTYTTIHTHTHIRGLLPPVAQRVFRNRTPTREMKRASFVCDELCAMTPFVHSQTKTVRTNYFFRVQNNKNQSHAHSIPFIRRVPVFQETTVGVFCRSDCFCLDQFL